jgi:hypothetical protein
MYESVRFKDHTSEMDRVKRIKERIRNAATQRHSQNANLTDSFPQTR